MNENSRKFSADPDRVGTRRMCVRVRARNVGVRRGTAGTVASLDLRDTQELGRPRQPCSCGQRDGDCDFRDDFMNACQSRVLSAGSNLSARLLFQSLRKYPRNPRFVAS